MVFIPHQLGNHTELAGATVHAYIGAATQIVHPGNWYHNKCDNDVDGDTTYETGQYGLWLTHQLHVLHTLVSWQQVLTHLIKLSMNVVREARALSNGTTTDDYGNIALGPNLWPFIQLYDFTRYQTYDLVYERGRSRRNNSFVL